jgi:plastocyanin
LVLGLGALHGCGGDDDNPAGPGPGGGGGTGTPDVLITITGNNGANSYSPSTASVTAGQLVAWQNNDNMAHTATGANFDTGTIASGARSDTVRITTVGNLPYVCTIHSGMTGALNVTP